MKKLLPLVLVACLAATQETYTLFGFSFGRAAETKKSHHQEPAAGKANVKHRVKHKTPTPPAVVPEISQWGFADNVANYMKAHAEESRGEYNQAKQTIRSIIDSGGSVYAHEMLLRILQEANDHNAIIELMPEIGETFESDPDIQLIFALALARAGKQKESDNLLIKLSQQFGLNPDIVFHAVQVFLRRKEPADALAVLERILNDSTKQINQHLFRFLKAQVHIFTHDYQKALAELDTSLEKNPYFERAILLRALILEQQGKVSDAKKGYEAYLELTGNADEQVRQHLHELNQRQNMHRPTHRSPHPPHKGIRIMYTTAPNHFQKAAVLFKNKQYALAQSNINKHLQSYPNDVGAKLLKLQTYVAAHKGDTAIKTVVEWINQEPNTEIWHQTLHLLSYSGIPRHKVIEAFESIHTKYPHNVLAIMYLANLYLRANNAAKASSYLHTAYKACTDDSIKAKILFQIGVMAYENSAYHELATLVKQAEALQTEFAPLQNLMSYYYATHGGNLKKAQTILQKVLQHNPDNAHYLDTKGVILYKQRKYKEAQSLLQKVSTRAPHDATILIHLAKSHHKLGAGQEALSAIRKAQSVAQSTYEKTTTHKLINTWAHAKRG